MKSRYYPQGGFLVLISILILSAVSVYAAEESITLTTYYPSPYGVYNELRLYPKGTPSGACSEGTMYYNQGNHTVMVCGGFPSDWQSLGGGGGFWSLTGNNLYPTNTTTWNVGVGTASPGQKLAVQAADAASPTGTGATIHLQSDMSASANRGGSVLFGDTGTTRAMIKGAYEGAGNSGYLAFSTKTSIGTMTEALRVNSGGNIGIGTVSPSSLLDVSQTVNSPTGVPNLALTQYSDLFDGNNGAPKLWFRRARGTPSGPALPVAGDTLGSFVFGGYAGAGNFDRGGRIAVVPAENWTSTSHGTYMEFEVANVGASATAEAMRITPSGTIGLGSSNVDPTERLTIYGTSNGDGGPRVSIRTSAGVTEGPKLRLFHQGEVGGRLWCIRSAGSADPGSGATGNFDIYDATAGISRLIITSGGNVGINTLSPSAKLTVNGDGANPNFRIYDTSGILRLNFGGAYALNLAGSTGANNAFIPTDGTSNTYFATLGGNVGIGTSTPGAYKLYVNGSAWSTGGWGGSDIRWKKNIEPLENSLSKVISLQGVNFEWKKDEYPSMGFDNGVQIGLIAQDVEKIIPELVKTDTNGYKSVSYEKLSAVLVEAVKEQQGEIKSLKGQIEEIKAKNDALKARLDEVEKKLK